VTKNKNSPPRGGLAPLINRRAVLALGLGSAAAVILPFAHAPAAETLATSRGQRARASRRDARAGQDQSSSNWRASPITRSKISPSVFSTGSATGLICFST
jgi:hypothetical protein